jgi:DNA-binding NtrC family response regulator
VAVNKLLSWVRRAKRWIAPPVVLCAEDDENVRTLYVKALNRAGFVTEIATNGRDALEKIEKYYYSAILLDLGMPYLHGATLLALLQKRSPDLLRRLIIVTGASDAMLADVRANVSTVLRKPVSMDELVSAVRVCVGDMPVAGDQTALIP